MIIISMLAKKQDWCFDILLDIISAIIFKINEAFSLQSGGVNATLNSVVDSVMLVFEPAVELLNPYYDSNVIDRASQALLGIY